MNPFPLPPHASFPQNLIVEPDEQNNPGLGGNIGEKNADAGTAGRSLPSPATLQRNKTLPRFIAELASPAPHTGVKIDGENVQPGPDMPPVVAQFIEQTLQNGRYDSPEHLQLRAENFFRHIDAERAINAAAKEAMTQPESPIARQSAHMAHLLRGIWSKAGLASEVREQLAKDINQGNASERELISKRAHLFEGAKDIHAMFARAEEGPLTFEQSKHGVETAYLLKAAMDKKLASYSDLFSQFHNYVAENWVSADRAGHHFKDEGVSLTQDPGSNIRDELGLPVMLGTSGSSSGVALATKFASAKQEVPMWPAELTEEEGRQTLIDAVHHYMREQVTPISAKGAYNKLRTRSGAEPKDVEPVMVFTHNYPEVTSAIEMTINEENSKDENALRRTSMQALERLSKMAPR